MHFTKTTGNFTTEAIILTVAGRLAGGIKKTLSRETKQKNAETIARLKTNAPDMVTPRKRPKMMDTNEMPFPKANDASPFSMVIVSSLIERDIRRSRVLDYASHGTTIGDIEVALISLKGLYPLGLRARHTARRPYQQHWYRR